MGGNSLGQLGLGTMDDNAHPTAAQLVTLGSNVVQVAAGYALSAALTADGEVYLCGSFWWPADVASSGGVQTTKTLPTRIAALGTDTVQLALGNSFVLVLKQGGAVYSWGLGNYGQLGLGDLGGDTGRLSPEEITGLGTDNAYITAQSDGGMVLKSDGRLFNWGSNVYHSLGDGTTTDRFSPVELVAVGSDNAHVVGGGNHALLLKTDGSVLSWGWNVAGQIGNGACSLQLYTSSSPCTGTNQVRVQTPCPHANPCAASRLVRLVLTCSARNHAPSQATPVIVSLPSAAVQIAAATYNSYAMLVDGSVWGWGINVDGQLGDGTMFQRLSPVQIEGYGVDISMHLPPGGAVAGGTMFVVAADGTVMGSGWNDGGRLGNGGTANVLTAGAIPELGGGVVHIARGYDHTLVLKDE